MKRIQYLGLTAALALATVAAASHYLQRISGDGYLELKSGESAYVHAFLEKGDGATLKPDVTFQKGPSKFSNGFEFDAFMIEGMSMKSGFAFVEGVGIVRESKSVYNTSRFSLLIIDSKLIQSPSDYVEFALTGEDGPEQKWGGFLTKGDFNMETIQF